MKQENYTEVGMITVKELLTDDLRTVFLDSFEHNQTWKSTWVNLDGEWKLFDKSGNRQWSDKKRKWIPEYLTEQIRRGGSVFGAYDGGRLVGFSSVDGILRGENIPHANLTMLFVDDRYQRMGIGEMLFREAVRCARGMGARRLFVSAIPSADTIAFYFAMGCRDAEEIVAEFVDSENDRYLSVEVI